MRREGQPVNVMGLPALSGPFERPGIDRMVGLGWTYVGLSVLEVLVGILVWQRRRAGAWLSVAVIPSAIVFWFGFAPPLPPVAAAFRLALLCTLHNPPAPTRRCRGSSYFSWWSSMGEIA